ncbi:MAG: gamma carbonic anhydrase family protein [Candidatus Saccharicenans sp.]|jgi:carbonic anhydrase/acetyltransferase-like protein (isoleucine patch superfamily)|nr:gamma carbonic anhydrase family protein [Candidatus Saccharicenans sp.]MDH7494095.1 gamma carbonic anhydrase family protein [Candidatus Saccharicenans sp.]
MTKKREIPEAIIHPEAFVADRAVIIGRVTLKKGASIWYNAVLRADIADIVIGEFSNIQDNCVVHVDYDTPTIIGDYVTVGHGAILHACKIGNNTLIGMGAVVLDRAIIPDNCLVAAGALIPPGKTFPSGTLILGNPAKVARTLTPEEIQHLHEHALSYHDLWQKNYRR